MCLACSRALTGVESDQEDTVAHTLHELPGRYRSQIAIVLLEAEYGSLFISPSMPHKMHDTLALACYKVAHLLDGRRAGALQSDALGDFPDDVSQAHPFAVDVERLYAV